MTAMVRFRAAGTTYALPVSMVLAVRPAEGVTPLPSSVDGVVGIMPGEPAVSIIAPLGGDGRHIVMVHTVGCDYGLLVDEVIDVVHVDESTIQPAPRGQNRTLVVGLAERDGSVVLILDAHELGTRVFHGQPS
jgi:chemotaxis signal transduction protein